MKTLLTSFGLLSMLILSSSDVVAATITFNTFDGEFDFRVENQGWWSATLANSTGNTNYLTGEIGADLLRSFFTFDLSTLDLSDQTLVSATLQVARYGYKSPDATETVEFFDVSTPAEVLNDNTGVSADIFADLGSGTSYGSFVVPAYASSDSELLAFSLNGAALAAITTNAGGFFSIGGSLESFNSVDDERIFSGSIGENSTQQLVLETRPIAVPEARPLCLVAVGVIGAIARRQRRRIS
jgi:hypothetical protein